MPHIDVLSYGTIGLDRVYAIPHWPHSDISTHTSGATEHLGGKASNTAVFLGLWGFNAAPAGTILGDDYVGTAVHELLKESAGIDVRYIEKDSKIESMYCLIFVKPNGERAIIGVNTDGHPCTILTREMIERASCLTLDLYGGSDRVDAARMAHNAGRPVVVGDLRRADHEVIPYSTITIASAPEIRIEYPGLDLRDFAFEVLGKGPSHVVITDGANPALLISRDQVEKKFQPPAVDVVDTTGAGDALRAGVVYGLLQGMSQIDFVKFGIASGSLAVTQLGACSHPPTLDEVTHLARQVAVEQLNES